ncbi:hypothetical protein IV38_GL000576 [Lactobacillus selangorensis]|uniref:Uncharacterized protein n=1 Tax=Lactobacillus selangorensis TaxID=81857 RepID=A0A0R2G2Q6_9LACO|nr:hypothetical protein IV38_GL000576 [Lactobacillus selangorensis]KRN33782.1 hypothetical protein IV40_GL000092 [Lactobacillus selangorensis]
MGDWTVYVQITHSFQQRHGKLEEQDDSGDNVGKIQVLNEKGESVFETDNANILVGDLNDYLIAKLTPVRNDRLH